MAHELQFINGVASTFSVRETPWHPEGLLGKPCPVCGYRYGTAWLREEVPADVLEFLRGLPDDSENLPVYWRR